VTWLLLGILYRIGGRYIIVLRGLVRQGVRLLIHGSLRACRTALGVDGGLALVQIGPVVLRPRSFLLQRWGGRRGKFNANGFLRPVWGGGVWFFSHHDSFCYKLVLRVNGWVRVRG
jgi:hypothetical protein